MKKLFFIISFLFIQILCVKAYDFTDTFYYDYKIPNMYVSKIKDGRLKNTATFMLHRSNSDYVYCIDPFTSEIDGIYEAYIGYNTLFNLSKEQINRMNLLAHYGYEYPGHTDLKWYGVTQYLIWETLNLDDIYFTDTYYGNKIIQYTDEINELNQLVSNHYIKPNFYNLNNNYSIKTEYVLEDSNNVLKEYDIEYSNDIKVTKEDNKLKIYSDKVGNYQIKFIKKSEVDRDYILYSKDGSQNMFYPGRYDDIEASVNINFIDGTLEIIKQDSEKKDKQGQALLMGATYGLFDGDKLIKEIVTDEYGHALIEHLPLKKYTLKELNPSIGYQLDKTIYNVNLDISNTNVVMTVYEDVIKNKIKIIKKYGNEITNNYYLEPDVAFELYDNNNLLIDTYITNEQGEINLELPYGDYLLKQITGIDNYTVSEIININVSELDKEQQLEILDKEIIQKGNLEIVKKGSDGVLLDGVTFKLFAKDDIVSLSGNIYYHKDDLIDEIVINNGIGIINDLYYGNYYLVETSGQAGYLMNTSPIDIVIDKQDNNMEIINEKYEIPNTGKNDNNYFKIISDFCLSIGLISLYASKKHFNYN